MAYPDDLLASGERVLVHKHPHWKMLIVPVLALLLVVAAASFLAAVISAQASGQPWAGWGLLAVAVLGLAVIGWLTVGPVIRWRTTHFVVTDRRVLVREGLIARHGLDIPLSRINSVQTQRTVLERLLGCGTLVVESAADEPLEFTDIPDVEGVHAMLNRGAVHDR